MFNLLYKFLYRINIEKNDYVIVQQSWLRRRFREAFGINNIIVAHPDIDFEPCRDLSSQDGVYRFFYPSFPRVFKNFEVICEAARILNESGIRNFEVLFTINGKETRYSKYIYAKYKDVSSLKFIGIQTKNKIRRLYGDVNCMIFSSKLESWGIPITEFKRYSKPMLLADLEYTRETAGDYNKVNFFRPDDPKQLACFMNDAIGNRPVFEGSVKKLIAPPYASNWKELFDILLEGQKCIR